MIKIENFSKKYINADFYSAREINLVIEDGEVLGLVGSNGAGKSTLIKCITGILPFHEGKISIDGFDVSAQPEQAKRRIGYVPDNHVVYEKLTGARIRQLYRQFVRGGQKGKNGNIGKICEIIFNRKRARYADQQLFSRYETEDMSDRFARTSSVAVDSRRTYGRTRPADDGAALPRDTRLCGRGKFRLVFLA